MDLSQFRGTRQWYKHWAQRLVYTDGVKYLAEQAGAFWLIDAIASYQMYKQVWETGFQLWELKKNEDESAVLTMREDSGKPERVRQNIKYTDFPLDYIKLYVVNGGLMLPSEY